MRARLLYSVCDQTFPVFVFPPLPPALRAERNGPTELTCLFQMGSSVNQGPKRDGGEGRRKIRFGGGKCWEECMLLELCSCWSNLPLHCNLNTVCGFGRATS